MYNTFAAQTSAPVTPRATAAARRRTSPRRAVATTSTTRPLHPSLHGSIQALLTTLLLRDMLGTTASPLARHSSGAQAGIAPPRCRHHKHDPLYTPLSIAQSSRC